MLLQWHQRCCHQSISALPGADFQRPTVLKESPVLRHKSKVSVSTQAAMAPTLLARYLTAWCMQLLDNAAELRHSGSSSVNPEQKEQDGRVHRCKLFLHLNIKQACHIHHRTSNILLPRRYILVVLTVVSSLLLSVPLYTVLAEFPLQRSLLQYGKYTCVYPEKGFSVCRGDSKLEP